MCRLLPLGCCCRISAMPVWYMAMLAPVRTLLRHIDAMETLWRTDNGMFTHCVNMFDRHSTSLTYKRTAQWRWKQRAPSESFSKWSSIRFTCWQQNHKGSKWLQRKQNSNRLEQRGAVSYSSACGSSSRGGKTHWLMDKSTWRVYKPPGSRWQVSWGKFQLGVAKPPTFPPTLLRTWSTQPTSPALHRGRRSFLFP